MTTNGARTRLLVTIALCAGVALLTGCTRVVETAGAQSSPAPSATDAVAEADLDTGDGDDLFSEDGPKMVSVTSGAETRGEFIVPRFCRGRAAGLRQRGDGFLLAVRMEGDIPPTDDPPGLPFGVVLLMHELHLGVFAPDVDTELGGGYNHVRQYQLPDRPANQKNDLGAGNDEVLEQVDVDVDGPEFRVGAPSVGEHTDRVTQWGVNVTCILRHPVDGVYFARTRIPLGEFERLPIG